MLPVTRPPALLSYSETGISTRPQTPPDNPPEKKKKKKKGKIPGFPRRAPLGPPQTKKKKKTIHSIGNHMQLATSSGSTVHSMKSSGKPSGALETRRLPGINDTGARAQAPDITPEKS